MNKGGRFILLLIILSLSDAALYRTFQWYYMIPKEELDLLKLSEDELDVMPADIKVRVQELKNIRKRALALGLDLQGGVSIIIQVNEDDLRAQLLDKTTMTKKRSLPFTSRRRPTPCPALWKC
jgi:hypothetical protein